MQKSIFFFTLAILFSLNGFSQLSLKLKFPKCELKDKSILSSSKENQTMMITTQEEFDKMFKITDDTKLNFEKHIVLVAMLGTDNKDKYIYVDAASFLPENRKLLVRWDYKNDYFRGVNSEDITGEYCVAVIQRMDIKKVKFLKGNAYSARQNYRD